MSRLIENDHPWDEDEIAYMESRGRFADVKQNKADFPEGWTPPETDETEGNSLELDPDIYEHVRDASIDQLKSELNRAGLSAKGTETDLKVRLAQHLQDERDQQEGGDSNS